MRADLTRSVIHHHFSNKRVLWDAVVAQGNTLVVGRARQLAQAEGSLLDRLSALVSLPTQGDAEARSATAFLVTSVLESRRHPELKGADHGAPEAFREVISWAVNDAIDRGELETDVDDPHLIEMLVALVWGMGYYGASIGADAERAAVVDAFDLLITNNLWRLHEPSQQAWQDGGVPLTAQESAPEALPAPAWSWASANVDELAQADGDRLVS